MKINFLQNILDPTNLQVISVMDYFDYVRGAKFETEIKLFRDSKNESKDIQTKIKNRIPAVTISGTFTGKASNATLNEHSGLICIDFDHVLNIAELKSQLEADDYTFAVLYSASGKGLAALVKIDGLRHADSYDGLKTYYFKQYHQLIDKSCRNVSRLRFLSMDRDLFVNPKSKTFKEYPKKERAPKQFNVVLTNNEFDELIEQIRTKNIDLTEGDYSRYLHLGFAVSSRFGESGRHYYHTICQANSKYDPARCDKQFDYCMRGSGDKKIGVGTFYHYAKLAGLELKSRESYQLEAIAKLAKRQSRTQESVVHIAKTIGLDTARAAETAKEIFDNNVNLEFSGETSVGLCRTFIQSNYDLRYNIITGNIENRAIRINQQYQIITDMELNTMFLKFSESTEAKITKDFFFTFIFSEFTDYYNPFLEFFETHKDVKRSESLISELAMTIETDTENVEKFIRHWVCGMIAGVYGIPSSMVLVLAGEKQNTGKTQWFRRLMPKELKPYYAESKLDSGKDDFILMCRKILIMDDEFSNQSKAESRHLKALTSKDTFSIRMPYGRVSKDMQRIASLAGTTNDLNLISDPTGNRRILPVNVLSVDHEKYNAIDKVALLMAFYDLYHSGFKWELTSDDIALLKSGSDNFLSANPEADLIRAHLEEPLLEWEGDHMTNTEIKGFLEIQSGQKIYSQSKLGQELKNAGYRQKIVRERGVVSRLYFVKKKHQPVQSTSLFNPTSTSPIDEPDPPASTLPF